MRAAHLLDDDGYPTDETLAMLESFTGTPHEYVDLIASIWAYGGPSVTDETDWLDRAVKHVHFVTSGWSGNESVVGVMHDSMFWFAFWEMSQRGGAYTFNVPVSAWDAWQLQPLITPAETEATA